MESYLTIEFPFSVNVSRKVECDDLGCPFRRGEGGKGKQKWEVMPFLVLIEQEHFR